MKRRVARLVVLGVLLLTASCAGARYETVTYPPRIDLTKHELIGVLEFSSPDEKELASMVTARFVESARSDQGLVRMVTLSSERTKPDTARLRELAHEHGLQTIVLGDLRISKVRPSVSISDALSSANVSGAIEGTLDVQIIEPATGASLWSASARSRETVGNVSVQVFKAVGFDAVSPDSAYAALVDTLVAQVTRDMRSSWERRRIN